LGGLFQVVARVGGRHARRQWRQSRCQLRRSRWCRTAGCRGGATGGTRWVRCRRWGHGGVIFGEKGLAGDASLKLLATPDANRRPVRRVPVRRNRGKNATRSGSDPFSVRISRPRPLRDAVLLTTRQRGLQSPFWQVAAGWPAGAGKPWLSGHLWRSTTK
jgi:hypothetical protein